MLLFMKNMFVTLGDKMATKFIENFISSFPKPYNTDEIVDVFWNKLKMLEVNELTDIILSDIYIPDDYNHDSSEETLFTKLVEVLTSYVFSEIGIKSEYLKTKSGTEDIHLTFNKNKQSIHIVGDVKTYRLGRSQKAANVKDFVKPSDFRDIWGKKYGEAYGLVVFPSTHEWSKSSDVYQHCTNPNYPIVMMHYSHLAVLLNKINERNEEVEFESLWDYSTLTKEEKNKKSKENYWNIFNKKFNKLFNEDIEELSIKYEKIITDNIKKKIDDYENIKQKEIKEISKKINDMNERELRSIAKELLIEKRVKKINSDIERIKKFRL
ncbi:hypothetical protein BUZ46_07180 [Staphylococcus hominis]|nr:hypothetical protein BUZ46_07180 [Staphylococcus hominis]RIO60009.1 HindIII family type II restriction endonuclease [Staphylococcus hominis]